MAKLKYYDTQEFGIVTVHKASELLGVSSKTLINLVYKKGDINTAISSIIQKKKEGPKLTACVQCGKESTHSPYCSTKCRKTAYFRMYAEGTLSTDKIKKRVCACGCERTFDVIVGYDFRMYYEKSCKYKKFAAIRASKDTTPVSIKWVGRYQRPELCKTCAKYVVCSDYMASNNFDRGWPCERKNSFVDYVKSKTNIVINRSAIDTTDTTGYIR